MLQVSEEFVREAHKVACFEWQQRIEKEFPTIFHSQLNAIKALPEYKELSRNLGDFYRDALLTITENGKYAKILLPQANKTWTVNAWKLATVMARDLGYYPKHGFDSDKTHITLVKEI